jgi:hypothetical protein
LPALVHEHLRTLAADPVDHLDRLNDVAWESTDPIVLEMCRLRIADMLGDQAGMLRRTPAASGLSQEKVDALPTWWTSDLFTSYERARIAFTEQFVMSVSAVSDADVNALLADDDAMTVYNFVNAVYVLDLTTRVDMVTRTIFDDPVSDDETTLDESSFDDEASFGDEASFDDETSEVSA